MPPPRTRFSREDVLEAAFQLTREQGLEKLSARRIATRLGASTAPVYKAYGSMSELEHAVVSRSRDLLLEYIERPYTDQMFLNMGLGFAYFARDERLLFRDLFMESDQHRDILESFDRATLERMDLDPQYQVIDQASRHFLLHKMRVFTHGLACLLNVGWLPDDSDEHIQGLLEEVGTEIIAATFLKSSARRQEQKEKVIL